MRRENKIAFLRVKLLEGWKDIDIRRRIEIPRSTYFYWKDLIKQGNYTSLVNKQKPGPKSQFYIDPVNARRIQTWRKTYGWGPTKIEGHLDQHYKIHIPHNKIHQLLKDKGLNKPIGQPRKTWGKKRWERKHSMSLWQGDWKDVNSPHNPMLTFYDDHSRFITASRRFPEATMENSIKLLERAFKRYGIPEQILTDRGSHFWNNKGEGPTDFTQLIKDSGAMHIKASKARPTTCGKIENFHGCYDQEIWVTKGDHAKFVRYWNYRRPNGAINYLYPIEVFKKDRKSPTNSG